MANDCTDAAFERINEARTLLQEYTNGTNLVEDDDVEDGLVKKADVEDIISNIYEIYCRLLHADEWTDVDDVEKSLRTLIQCVRGDTQQR